MRRTHSAFVLALLLAGGAATPGAAGQTRAAAPREASRVEVEVVAKGIAHPWSLRFLPDGAMLVTERGGNLRVVDMAGTVSAPVAGVPKVVTDGQGGLLDVALAPDFPASGTVFLTFSEPRGGNRNGTSVARGRLVRDGSATRLEQVSVVFRQKPDYASNMHFGSRIVPAADGTLFVTLGDRYYPRDQAQNPAVDLGKVVRINQDGSIPADNPKLPGWAPEVWSIGHRNPQGAATSPATGRLWIVEHGARGGDEVNIALGGRNYGWPVITYGRDYSGARIGTGTAKAGMEQPVYYWDPSIAPSGLSFYTGDLFPGWKGSLLVGALAGEHLSRLVLEGDAVVAEERLLADRRERIRDVRQGPDEAVYVVTDARNGRILRLRPAQR